MRYYVQAVYPYEINSMGRFVGVSFIPEEYVTEEVHNSFVHDTDVGRVFNSRQWSEKEGVLDLRYGIVDIVPSGLILTRIYRFDMDSSE